MTTNINLWDSGVWSFVITVTILLVGMIVANILRNTVKIIRRFMIPSSVLGGFILLFANFIWKQFAHTPMYSISTLEILTYHGLGLGFVAMSLRTNEQNQSREKRRGGFDTGTTVVATYLMQGILGLIISVGLYYAMDCFFASGLILPMGYGQGPGQAFNWGSVYENTFGFVHGTSFGLTVAAMGFVASSIGGIIYLNILRKRGLFSGKTGDDVIDDDLTAEQITGKGEIPLSESIDKFTVQFALVFIAYMLAFLLMWGVNCLIEAGYLGEFGHKTIQPLIWGFNFLFGTIFALLLKGLFKFLKKKNIMRREYTNNFMQNRIAGFMFDMMVVASIAAIDLSAFTVKEFVVPLSIMCVLGGVITYIYLDYLCKRVFPEYRHEAFLSLYGMLTGTASTGVILMREIDPKFESVASSNLVYHQPWAIAFGFPMLLLLSFAPQNVTKSIITIVVLTVLFIAMNIITFRRQIFKSKKK